MPDNEKDKLIEAQKQVIGILFEVIKRFQKNNDLDEEYFQLVSSNTKNTAKQSRLELIQKERTENSEIINRLLKQLEI